MSEPEPTACGLDPTLLSGFLDGVLSQNEEQLVNVHVRTCDSCRRELEEMRMIRDTAMTTRFVRVPDSQWDETPRNPLSRWARNLGWGALLVWLLTAVILVTTRPAPMRRWLEELLIWGAVVGCAALLLSVAIDRWRTARTDIYRGVKK